MFEHAVYAEAVSVPETTGQQRLAQPRLPGLSAELRPIFASTLDGGAEHRRMSSNRRKRYAVAVLGSTRRMRFARCSFQPVARQPSRSVH